MFVTGTIFVILECCVLAGLLCVGLLVLSFRRSARKLAKCCAAELDQLKSLLSSRHLIISHLNDSIPSRLDGLWNRRELEQGLRRAEKGLLTIDPSSPDVAALRMLEDNEQCLVLMVEDLQEVLDHANISSPVQPISGCLDGLEKKSQEILEAVSTYNTAVITFNSFLNSSRMATRNLKVRYDILDVEPPGSSVSGDSGVPNDRLAS
jgi:hypothetical protein